MYVTNPCRRVWNTAAQSYNHMMLLRQRTAPVPAHHRHCSHSSAAFISLCEKTPVENEQVTHRRSSENENGQSHHHRSGLRFECSTVASQLTSKPTTDWRIGTSVGRIGRAEVKEAEKEKVVDCPSDLFPDQCRKYIGCPACWRPIPTM